jgi:hypothetical protein
MYCPGGRWEGSVEPGNVEEAQIADVTGGVVEWKCGAAG